MFECSNQGEFTEARRANIAALAYFDGFSDSRLDYLRMYLLMLPGESCRTGMNFYIQQRPPIPGTDCGEWLWQFHNHVNSQLQKPAVALEYAKARWTKPSPAQQHDADKFDILRFRMAVAYLANPSSAGMHWNPLNSICGALSRHAEKSRMVLGRGWTMRIDFMTSVRMNMIVLARFSNSQKISLVAAFYGVIGDVVTIVPIVSTCNNKYTSQHTKGVVSTLDNVVFHVFPHEAGEVNEHVHVKFDTNTEHVRVVGTYADMSEVELMKHRLYPPALNANSCRTIYESQLKWIASSSAAGKGDGVAACGSPVLQIDHCEATDTYTIIYMYQPNRFVDAIVNGRQVRCSVECDANDGEVCRVQRKMQVAHPTIPLDDGGRNTPVSKATNYSFDGGVGYESECIMCNSNQVGLDQRVKKRKEMDAIHNFQHSGNVDISITAHLLTDHFIPGVVLHVTGTADLCVFVAFDYPCESGVCTYTDEYDFVVSDAIFDAIDELVIAFHKRTRDLSQAATASTTTTTTTTSTTVLTQEKKIGRMGVDATSGGGFVRNIRKSHLFGLSECAAKSLAEQVPDGPVTEDEAAKHYLSTGTTYVMANATK